MDIISLPIEHENERIDGSYRLVIASVMRAKALSSGSLPKIASKARKITTLAVEEVSTGAVDVFTGEEAAEANTKAKRLTQKRMMDEAQQKESMPEDLSELEKDLKVYLRGKSGEDKEKSFEDIFGD